MGRRPKAKAREREARRQRYRAKVRDRPQPMGPVRLSVEEIASLGFPWPPPGLPPDCIAAEEDGRIDLGVTRQRLRAELGRQERLLADAHAFKMRYGGQMSVLEYSDHKDSYDENRGQREALHGAVGAVGRIIEAAQEIRGMGAAPEDTGGSRRDSSPPTIVTPPAPDEPPSPRVDRALYLVILVSFLLPFATVKGCSGQDGPTYTGVELIQEAGGALLAGVPLLAALLLGLSFRRTVVAPRPPRTRSSWRDRVLGQGSRPQAGSVLGMVQATRALLCALAGLTAAFITAMTSLFTQVSGRIGLYLCLGSWAVLYARSTSTAIQCTLRARRASRERPPPWGLAVGALLAVAALLTTWLSRPNSPAELFVGYVAGILVAVPLVLMALLAAARPRLDPSEAGLGPPATEDRGAHSGEGDEQKLVPARERPMRRPGSRLIQALCIVYSVTAAAGVFVALWGKIHAPAPLPSIDQRDDRGVVLEQARLAMEAAEQRRPSQPILATFYKDWLLESGYRELSAWSQPRFEGDSFERRVASYSDTASHVDEIYRDSTTALALLSSGGLILSILMLSAPGYLRSLLLAACPLAAVFVCVQLGIGYHALEYCWIPFVALGAAIFLLQLIHSFRFGRPEHRTVDSLPGLMIYRRGVALVSLGAFLLLSALMVASVPASGTGHSGRTILALALLGEDGAVVGGLAVGALFVGVGLYYLRRKPTDDVF